jgi:hypothetical protein
MTTSRMRQAEHSWCMGSSEPSSAPGSSSDRACGKTRRRPGSRCNRKQHISDQQGIREGEQAQRENRQTSSPAAQPTGE